MKLWEIIKKLTEGEIKPNECKYYSRNWRGRDDEKIILAIENSNIVFYDGDIENFGDQDFVLEDFTEDWEEMII